MKKKSNIQKMRDLQPNKKVSFPIASMYSVRNSVSSLNAIHLNDGMKWASAINSEKGVITVTRVL